MIRSLSGKIPKIADSASIREAASDGTVIIGDGVVMGHGAVSNCHKISNHVLIGMNATLLHDAKNSDYCIIATGCLVRERMKIRDRFFVPCTRPSGRNQG